MSEEQPLVVCKDCARPCKTPVSRARRIGARCWRKRRAAARKLAATMTSSTLPIGQDGPTLLDDLPPGQQP